MSQRTLSFAALLLLSVVPVVAASKETVLYSFCSVDNCTDGANPASTLITDQLGNLYGTTDYGGAYGFGTVFELVKGKNDKWSERVLYSFKDANGDGSQPDAGLVFDAKGHLYGTTSYGGAYGYGTVFELTPGPKGVWSEAALYSFAGMDGAYPDAGVTFDGDGNLYGTTFTGGTHGFGAVFELLPNNNGSWTERVLHSFVNNGKDGHHPTCALTLDAKGNVYGTTPSGGVGGYGIVFEASQRTMGVWTEKILHAFDRTDGMRAWAGVTSDANGTLYGTTASGGGDGVVFQLVRGANGVWSETILNHFKGKNGAIPLAGLIFDSAGNLYSTTDRGGAYTFGAVFELTLQANGRWRETILHSFDKNGTDGINPSTGLVLDSKGNLYGTTSYGGSGKCSDGCGTVYEVSLR